MVLSNAEIIYSKFQHGELVYYKTDKTGGKTTVPGPQGIPHGPGWDQTHICMVKGHMNET
jgi:hypothetical protein